MIVLPFVILPYVILPFVILPFVLEPCSTTEILMVSAYTPFHFSSAVPLKKGKKLFILYSQNNQITHELSFQKNSPSAFNHFFFTNSAVKNPFNFIISYLAHSFLLAAANRLASFSADRSSNSVAANTSPPTNISADCLDCKCVKFASCAPLL